MKFDDQDRLRIVADMECASGACAAAAWLPHSRTVSITGFDCQNSLAVPARSTLSVLLELIDTAQQEIMIVGYALTEGAVIVLERLSVAQRRGVRVMLIGNRLEQRLDFIRNNWPVNQPLPELYTRPISPDDVKSSLHAKVAIADRQRMLVTSANLTYHGLAGNVEIGVLVKSRDVSDVIYLFNSLIHHNLLLPV